MMRTKQDWVDLMFEVQTGERSCRNAADLIMQAINKEATMESKKTNKPLDLDALNELSELYQESANAYRNECAEFWNGLSYEDRLKAFYSVVSRLVQGELRNRGSYRHILYDVFEFDMDSYGVGMDCGFMELHNAIYDESELEAWADRNGYVKKEKE